jgi:hypothetical protein
MARGQRVAREYSISLKPGRRFTPHLATLNPRPCAKIYPKFSTGGGGGLCTAPGSRRESGLPPRVAALSLTLFPFFPAPYFPLPFPPPNNVWDPLPTREPMQTQLHAENGAPPKKNTGGFLNSALDVDTRAPNTVPYRHVVRKPRDGSTQCLAQCFISFPARYIV